MALPNSPDENALSPSLIKSAGADKSKKMGVGLRAEERCDKREADK